MEKSSSMHFKRLLAEDRCSRRPSERRSAAY